MVNHSRLLFGTIFCVYLLVAGLFCMLPSALANQDELGWEKLTMNDGSTFEGQTKDNQLNGFGIYVFSNGDSYYGMFENGKRMGYGIYFGGDTRNYYMKSGMWQDDMLNDTGSIYYRNHAVTSGVFEQDLPAPGQTRETDYNVDGKGFVKDLTLDDGFSYTGSYDTASFPSNMIGTGVLVHPDGSLSVGFIINFRPGTNSLRVSAEHVVGSSSSNTDNSSNNGSIFPSQTTRERCAMCGGAGQTLCSSCGGSGRYYTYESAPSYGTGIRNTYSVAHNCGSCGGSGRKHCSFCGGSGYK